jgi:hypothetical protein
VERSAGVSETLYGVAWTSTRAVAVGENGVRLESADGLSWEASPSGTTNDLLGVAWKGGRLLAIGASGTILTGRCDVGAAVRLPASGEPEPRTRVVTRD